MKSNKVQWNGIKWSSLICKILSNAVILFPFEPRPADMIASHNVQLSVRNNRRRLFRRSRNWFGTPLSNSPRQPSTETHPQSLLDHPKLVETLDLSKHYKLFWINKNDYKNFGSNLEKFWEFWGKLKQVTRNLSKFLKNYENFKDNWMNL